MKKKEEKLPKLQEFEFPMFDKTKSDWAPENAAPIRAARNLFLQNYPYERIFLLTGLPMRTFYKKKDKWTALRKRLDEKILVEIRTKAIEEQAEAFVEKGLHIGHIFLDRVIKREVELDAKEFKLVMDSVMAIHRVKQLETGEPTDISRYEAMSPEELRRYLQTVRDELEKKHGDILTVPSEDDAPVEEKMESFLKKEDVVN